ncbi:MAG: pantoate--beta-alanine ligase [Cytophagaceae bacterium]
MQVIHKIAELRALINRYKSDNQTIGFVPTMGALHEGHLSLVTQSAQKCSITVVSIFVNPLQFNNKEDFEKYPLTLENDLKLLESTGCQVVFAPNVSEMYPRPVDLTMDIGALNTVMEGAQRPGHFSGVCVVVSKLFNIVQPHFAFFGQKDLQQLAVIRQMVADLNFPIDIISCPIARDLNGLALSSRNQRLSPRGREISAHLFRSLNIAKGKLANGTPTEAVQAGLSYLSEFPEIQPEYLEVVDTIQLKSLTSHPVTTSYAICIAAYVEGVRLIDNIVVTV